MAYIAKSIGVPRNTALWDIKFIPDHSQETANSMLSEILANHLYTYGNLVVYISKGNNLEAIPGITSEFATVIRDYVEAHPAIASTNTYSIPALKLLEEIEFDIGLGFNEAIIEALQSYFPTYQDLVLHVFQGGEIGCLLESANVDLMPDFPRFLEDMVKNFIIDHPLKILSNSFSIITPSLPLEDKIKKATAGVDNNMIDIAVNQFKKGAVVIEP